MKKVILLFCLLVCSTLVFSQVIYLDPGNSIPTDAPQGLLVHSYSFSTGTTSPEATIMLDAGSASPALFSAVVNGTLFKKMELDTYTLGKLSSRITFSDVIITGMQLSGNTDALITLSFSRMRTK